MKPMNLEGLRAGRTLALGLLLLLNCLGVADRAWGYAELLVFKPEGAPRATNEQAFFDAGTWGTRLVPGVSFSKAAANSSNGGLLVFASAWVGGASSVAWQEVRFEAPQPVHVYATVKMTYTGSPFTYGYASWAGTSWRWAVHVHGEEARWHDHDLDAALTLETVGGKVIDLALLAAGGFEFPAAVEVLIDVIDNAWTMHQLSQDMANLLANNRATRLEETVHFTVPAGTHVFRVGLRANAAALATGAGVAMLRGQVEEIRLGLNTEEGQLPDLVVSGMVVENEDELRTYSPVTMHVERANVGNADAQPETFELVALPPDSGPPIFIRRRAASGFIGYKAIPAYTTLSEQVRWSGFTRKGRYQLLATVDPLDEQGSGLVAELNENNNQFQKTIRVRGCPPDAPLEPNLNSAIELQRNRPFTLWTSASDRDGDRLYYRFEVQAEDGGDWLALTNRTVAFTNGWCATNHVTITPVLEDPDLLPVAVSGADPHTYVTLPGSNAVYRIRARAADEDGISAPSKEVSLSFTFNTLPNRPSLTGDTTGDTQQAVILTAQSTDPEGDPIAFRFNWGDSLTPTWTEWIWCDPGTNSVTATHLYASPGKYCVVVEATDLYSTRYDSPPRATASSRVVDISDYWAPTNSLVVLTLDKDRVAPLPGVAFTITGATNIATNTGPRGVWQSQALPGTYTVTFTDVAGWERPQPQTRTLPYQGSIEFRGEYTHLAGAIQVCCNIPAQGTISGRGTAQGNDHSFSGLSWSAAGAWIGPHVIEYAPVDPSVYGLPVPPQETNTLTLLNSPITFYGRYIKRPLARLAFAYPTNSYLPPGAFVLANEDTLEFDASASVSPDQPTGGGLFPPLTLSVVRYRFEFDDGEAYEESEHDGAGDGIVDGKVRHTFTRAGRRMGAVTVFDSLGCASLKTNVEVWVKTRPEAHLTIEPSPAIAGETVTFTASGTDADPGDTIIAWEWRSRDGTLLSTNQTFATSNLAIGLNEIRLRVQGSDLVWSEPARELLEVLPPADWPALKRNPARLANQPAYPDRTYGQLPYGLAPGWPFLADSPIEGSPVAANLDGDWINGLEVVFVSRLGTLYVTDNAGVPRWSRAVGASSSTPAIGDLDGDGQPDIVVGSQTGIWAFDRLGNNLFTYTAGAVFEYAMPIIADVDSRAPGNEVAVTADDGSVHLIYRDGTAGTNQWPFSYGASPPANPRFSSAPAVAKLDTNTLGRELVVGGLDGNLYVLNASGSNIATYPVPGRPAIQTTPAIADVCPQVPGLEMVFGADNGVCHCVNLNGGVFTPVWQFAVTPPASIRSSPAIGMVGEGAGLQVVFGCDNGTVYVLKGTNGAVAGSFNCGTGVAVRSTPVIADIDTVSFDPSSQPEVLAGALNGTVYALNFGTGGRAVWTNRLSAMPIFSSPAAADLDHDPDLEILVGASDNGLYVLKATPNPALAPVVDFAAVPQSGGRPLTVAFTNLTSNTARPLTWWRWDFGDGCTVTDQDPVHTYQTPGTFTVSLTARNAHGSRCVTKTNYITVASVPLAGFAASPQAGAVPLAVQFTDQSRFGPEAWWWDFGDGGANRQPQPQHTYTQPGTYSVSLLVSNAHGTCTLTQANLITALAVCPVANFARDRAYGCAPLTVNFTDLSAHAPTSWHWDFGDGASSAQQHPAHTYQTPGRYLVSLTVSNTAGLDTCVSPQYLTVLAPSGPTALPVLDLGVDEGAGFTAHDATTNLNHGTLAGATWTAAGHAGSALYFRGGGQWYDGDAVIVPHAPGLVLTNPFRVEAWIKAGGTDHYLAVADKYEYVSGSGGRGFTLYLTGGRLRFSLYSGTLGEQSAWGTNELRDDTWHHVAGSWDGRVLCARVDGLAQGEVPWPHPPALTTAGLGIGKRLSGWGGYMPFQGSMDEVRVANLLPAEPLTLSIARVGGQIVISWQNCGILQWASEPTGEWSDVPDAPTRIWSPRPAPRLFTACARPERLRRGTANKLSGAHNR